MKPAVTLVAALLLETVAAPHATNAPAKKPNVLLLGCDDLNSYIEGFGGHRSTRQRPLSRLTTPFAPTPR